MAGVDPEWRQHRIVERGGAGKVTSANGQMTKTL
jgi:hypothetical protein